MYYLGVFVYAHMPYVVWACVCTYTWDPEDNSVKLDLSIFTWVSGIGFKLWGFHDLYLLSHFLAQSQKCMFFVLKKIFMLISIVFAWVCRDHMYAVPIAARRGRPIPGNWSCRWWEPPCGCREPDPDPLQEQASLQPPIGILLKINFSNK